ncbi:hypothetical protein HWV62_38136 [Athelia sp. TMB]|nr:hypothetical protein HWV62_38136 [Athelia sp. TMB]
MTTYSGDWVTSGSIEGEQTYDGTLHGTSTIGAEITFSFTGTSVYVYGTVAPTTVPAVTNYTIDGGVPFTFVAPIVDFAAGDFCFYQSPNLVDGVHTLVITNNANDVAYWFDYLTYKLIAIGLFSGSPISVTNSTTTTSIATTRRPPPPTTTTLPTTSPAPASTVPSTYTSSVTTSSSSSTTATAVATVAIASQQPSSPSPAGASSTPSLSPSLTSLASSYSSTVTYTSTSSAQPTSTALDAATSSSSSGLSTAAMVGIAAGAAFGAAILAVMLFLLICRVRRRPPALPTSIIFPTDSHFSASARDPSLPIVFDDDLAPSEGDYRQVERHGSKATLAAGVPRRDNDVYSEHTSWIGSHYPASEYRAVPT